MLHQHWFDILNKAVAHASPRREIARSLALLLPGLLLSDTNGAARNKSRGGQSGGNKKKGKKGKGKSKSKKPSRPSANPPPAPQSCSEGLCQSYWPGSSDIDLHNQNYCEFICEQCDGTDPREFCITGDAGSDGSNPLWIAACCEPGASCCGDDQRGRYCCDGDRFCCDNQCIPIDDPINKCCNGKVVDTGISPEHCGECDNACGDGQTCRNGQCTCPTTCPQGKNCIHGDGSLCVERPMRPDCHCDCPPGYKYCQHRAGHMVCVSDCSLVT